MPKKIPILPLVMGLVIEVCFAVILVLGNLRLQVPVFFMCFGLASVAYLIAIGQGKKMTVAMILVFGAFFRLTLLFAVPTLSDDIYRYVWDGRVLWAGINPYAFAPLAEPLAHLRDAHIFPKINHAELPTIYPPLAQIAFWMGYGISESIWGIKVLLVGADLVSCLLLVGILKHMKMAPQWVLIYCWHPLVVLEIAGSGHIEGLGVLAVLGGVWLFVKGKDIWGLGVLTGGILIKFIPLVLLPGFIKWKGWWPTNWRAFFIVPGVMLVFYTPFFLFGGSVFGSLGTYAEHWSFNSPVFGFFHWLLRDGQLARGMIGFLFCGTLFVLIWRQISFVDFLFCAAAAFVIFTPTLHPWYVLWLVPFLVFNRHLAWIVFSLLVVLSYQILIRYEAEGVWEEALWVQGVEFGGLVVFWLLSRFRQNGSNSWLAWDNHQLKS